jgi:hypothetical protein
VSVTCRKFPLSGYRCRVPAIHRTRRRRERPSRGFKCQERSPSCVSRPVTGRVRRSPGACAWSQHLATERREPVRTSLYDVPFAAATFGGSESQTGPMIDGRGPVAKPRPSPRSACYRHRRRPMRVARRAVLARRDGAPSGRCILTARGATAGVRDGGPACGRVAAGTGGVSRARGPRSWRSSAGGKDIGRLDHRHVGCPDRRGEHKPLGDHFG